MMDTKRFEIAYQNVTNLSFCPDGTHLVTGDPFGFLRQWSASAIDRLQANVWTINTKEQINNLAVSNDGRWIISRGTGSKITFWSSITMTRKREIDVVEQRGAIYALGLSNDSTRVASISTDNSVQIFDIASGNKLVLARLQSEHTFVDFKFSPDASQVAIATHRYNYRGGYGSPDSELFITVYNASSGSCSAEFSSNFGSGYDGSHLIFRIAWSLDDNRIFVASPRMITCFEMSTNTTSTSDIQFHAGGSHQQVSDLSIVTSGKFIACSAGSSLLFWDCVSRKQIGQTINHAKPINCMAITHDGRRLACGHDKGITIHNLEGVIPEDLLPGILFLPLMRISTTAFKAWAQGNPIETEAILADEIAQRSSPNRDSLVVYALVKTHLGEWGTALEKIEMSLQIKLSAIGRIAGSVALVGAECGEQGVALRELDLVCWDCDPSDSKLVLVIKSILLFICKKRVEAVYYLRHFIDTSDGSIKDTCLQVLGMMYLQQGDYGNAVEILGTVKNVFTTEDRGPLMTLSIIFNWNFENLKSTAWQRACERLYVTGSVKKVGETLLKMVSALPEDEKERAHSHILQEIISRSGEVTLLAWTGKSSTCNSCLPGSPEVYVQTSSIFSSHTLREEASRERIAKLREIVPLPNALMIYGSVTRSSPALFAQFHLFLPCIVFRVKALKKEQENIYHAETVGLGDVTFTTVDSLPLEQSSKLVFANPWIDRFRESYRERDEDEPETEPNPHVASSLDADINVEVVHEPMIEEVVTPPSRALDVDVHTRALELIARLGQPFSALLLLKRPDGGYKRVAADHEIVVREIEDDVLRDVRVEFLKVL